MIEILVLLLLVSGIIFLIAVYSKISSLTNVDEKKDSRLLLLENELRKKECAIADLQGKLKEYYLYVQGLQSAHQTETARLEKKYPMKHKPHTQPYCKLGGGMLKLKMQKVSLYPMR